MGGWMDGLIDDVGWMDNGRLDKWVDGWVDR
jgi:hypothetical protein